MIQLLNDLTAALNIPIHPALPPVVGGALFAGTIGGSMYYLSTQRVEKINNVLVGGVLAAFAAVLAGAAGHVDAGRLLDGHWAALPHGPLIPVLFVSCVYHNVVSTITMRLEGDREKIRRTILAGSAIPVAMFLAYDAAILGTGMTGQVNKVAIAAFSVMAIATSFVGFVEGLTDLWADARQTMSKEEISHNSRWKDFVATLFPPVLFNALSPDIFLNALDAAGTYGIAVLFGGLPAAMAWRNRRGGATKEFSKILGGGDGLLGLVAAVPVLLIGSRILEHVSSAL